MSLNEKRKVLVVVGATRGVGKAISEKFIEIGWHVVGLGRDQKRLQAMEQEYGRLFRGIAIDIRNPKDVTDCFVVIGAELQRIDMLVNNAAVFKKAKYLTCSYNDIDNIIDTNLKGIMYVTLAALKVMVKTKLPGRIINVASVASLHGIEDQSIYCASKYGLNGFAEALNQELIGPHNIALTTLYPGGIDTPLWGKSNPYPGDTTSLLQSKDIVSVIEYISTLAPRVVLKNMTIFPSSEWH
jgi:NADP-dependent 3-hydroxy acid dehydrogenase YdfG